MRDDTQAPGISVLMPTYNAERYVGEAIDSVLLQTLDDFELIVVDDSSTDGTANLLARVQDPRLRVLTNPVNLGLAKSLNQALAVARGRYIARIDHDDLCLPTRLAKQKELLDARTDVVLVASAMTQMVNGQLRPSSAPIEPDSVVFGCLLYFLNPVGHSTMMFRAEAVQHLGVYMDESLECADDYDFTHRMARLGQIALLPERLVVYRLHSLSMTSTRREEMGTKTQAVLQRIYEPLLGADAHCAAALIARHLIAGSPIRDADVLRQVGTVFDQLLDALLVRFPLNPDQQARLIQHAAALWWRLLQTSMRAGAAVVAIQQQKAFRRSGSARPPLHRLARSILRGVLPARPAFALKAAE